MTDQTRSRRSSSRRVSPMQTSPAKVATLPAPAPADPEPSLGDVRFDEWFATPVFESDVDERLEELAMSRRGPLRLAASTLLRVNARTERAKGRRSRRQQPTEDFYDSALWLDDSEDTWSPPEDEIEEAALVPSPPAASPPAAPRSAQARKKAPASRRKPPVERVAVETVPAEPPVVDLPVVDLPVADLPVAERVADRSRVPDLSDRTSPRPGIRARMSSALDRWAEKEAQSQERLERLLLPKRWQS